jgi:hypothetical protein
MKISGLEAITQIDPPKGQGTNPPPAKRATDVEAATQASIRAAMNKPAAEVRP